MILQTLLVTGGSGISSTEIYVDSTSAWTYAASLPRARSYFMAASFGNHVYVFGEY